MILAGLLFSCLSSFASEKVIVVYSIPTCAPCRQLKLNLDAAKIKYVDGTGDEVAKIEGYPTVIVLIDGKESKRFHGKEVWGITPDELKKLLE